VPIEAVIRTIAHVVWPLVLIGLGVLLVLRARGGGWSPSGRKLYRSRTDRMVAGVMGGVAAWLGVDSTLLRVVYVVLLLFTGFGPGLLLYFVAVILLPEEPFGATGCCPAPAPPIPPAPDDDYAPAPPPAAPEPHAPPVPPAS